MSRSDVVRRLRGLASRGVPISVRYLLPVHADLVGQALAIFGGFDRARSVAGLTAPELEHDPDVVIGALRSLARSGVRLDAATLTTMGESTLVEACVVTFGSLSSAAVKAGLVSAPAEPQRRPAGYGQHSSGGGREHGDQRAYGGDQRAYGGDQRGYGGDHRDQRDQRDQRHHYGQQGQQGFAQPPVSSDGQVSTPLALEILQKTALALGKVPAARDLPPDVARRLTTDYGSVRFAYLALRVHAEGAGVSQSAESAEKAASEPVAMVSQEAFAATARLSVDAGINRRNVEHAHMERAALAAASARTVVASPVEMSDAELDEVWAEVEQQIDAAAALAGERLRNGLVAALDGFVDEVSDLARHATLAALVPDLAQRAPAARAPVEEEDEEEEDEEEEDEDDDEEWEDEEELGEAQASENPDGDGAASTPAATDDEAPPSAAATSGDHDDDTDRVPAASDHEP